MNISAGELQEIMRCSGDVAANYAPLLNEGMTEGGICSKERVSMFLAQVGHESGRLKKTTENLNYSSKGLLATWPSRYNKELAESHHRKPELIANHVYGGRMGNHSLGDGWKYRGRGLIQLTGKVRYEAIKKDTGIDVVKNPDLLSQPEGAVMSACWYWKTNNLNASADSGDINRNTRLINGGYNGLDDRKALYEKAKEVLSWG